jgi:hypothetical protein
VAQLNGNRDDGGGGFQQAAPEMVGPHAVLIFFLFIQNRLNFKNLKWVPYFAPKTPNFCMRLAWDIMNNFLNCDNIQFLT